MQGIVNHVSLRLPAKSVQFQQAAAAQIACMAGEVLIPPTPGWKGFTAVFSPPPRCALSKGCRSKRSRNVRIRRFGGSARKLAGRACGRKGLVGERRESAPVQMLHKAKMQKPANRKAAGKPCKEEMRNEEDSGCKM
jgi:hypothetical protein